MKTAEKLTTTVVSWIAKTTLYWAILSTVPSIQHFLLLWGTVSKNKNIIFL
ncbi:hypothetical protein LC593_19695 [Nostoc sp. CHAB 5844]|nr:hypothetical protein [Nostoc sp. CHAB 5844]